MKHFTLAFSLFFFAQIAQAQAPAGDCPYPIIFIHGWTGSYNSWAPLYNNADFKKVWGGLVDTFWCTQNARTWTDIDGPDNVLGNVDDDVLVQFVNESNTLTPGCLYAFDYDNHWNQNAANAQIIKGGHWASGTSQNNSNQSALKKAGIAMKACIAKVLAANPSKKKVILVGHSMGGLEAREYLQRKNGAARQWWVNPSLTDGHMVAKLFTVGTPHRGCNTMGNMFSPDPDAADDRTGTPDLFSEAVRDMRYSYACGFLNLSNCPGVYLYGGNETNFGNWYWNNDVDCNGVGTTTNVQGVNISGVTQFGSGSSIWDGTYDSPTHALPTNVRYTYYVSNWLAVGCNSNYSQYGCAGDGVVDDQRAWLYTGGDGKTDNYLQGISVPMPTDGVDNRLSDRVASTNRVWHTDQTGDTEFIVRGFDEGDFPKFAWDVNPDVWYAGMTQIRPDKVPANSELTNTGNRLIDCDWFKVPQTQGTRPMKLEVVPQPGCNVRIDLYTTAPSLTANPNSTLFLAKNAGQSNLLTLTSAAVPVGTYYFRITHYLNTNGSPSTTWKTPYKYRITFPSLGLSNVSDELDESVKLRISKPRPMPVRDLLETEIFSPKNNLPVKISLCDATGRRAFFAEQNLHDGENELALQVEDLPAGFYVLMVEAEGKIFSEKVIKQ